MERVAPSKLFLIKQGNNYYSIKPEYYDTNATNFAPLELAGNLIPNKTDIENYGFNNLNDLNTEITINEEKFKPISKLYSKFDIKKYKVK